jgi:hypothetical protein
LDSRFVIVIFALGPVQDVANLLCIVPCFWNATVLPRATWRHDGVSIQFFRMDPNLNGFSFEGFMFEKLYF